MPLPSLPDPQPVIHLIEAFRSSKAMFTAVAIGVFDRLENQTADVATLASELQSQSEPLERLLNACVGLKLLRKNNDLYTNEPAANTYLCRRSPNTLVGYILYSDQMLYPLWAHLEEAIRDGGPQWKQLETARRGIFDHFFRTDEAMKTFLNGMHGFGLLSSPLVVSAFDLSPFRRFVDLGGATGHLAFAACERYPDLRVVIFDLARVIDVVQDDVARTPVASRIELRRGNFFSPDDIPEGDLFGLGRILHDWPDDKVASLLQSVHARLAPNGGILISEKLLEEDKSGPVSAHMQSLNMLVCTEGKERTLSEYRTLLEAAGFREVRGHITGAPLDTIFALKA